MVDLMVIVSHLGLTEDQDVVQGYEAYYEYGRAKAFLACPKNADGSIPDEAAPAASERLVGAPVVRARGRGHLGGAGRTSPASRASTSSSAATSTWC